jgi:deazaflavin-dependent oxidoreductase (nitroreductase family)
MRTPSSSSPVWKAVNGFTRLHTAAYRALGGRFVGRVGRAPMLLLHHKGAKSGTERVTPLIYLEDGPRLVVVASKGGTDRHPAWFHNLMAHPDTTVEVGRERRPVRARTATPEERERLWPRAVEIYGAYEDYRRQADEVGREIPIVVLDPA